MLLRIIQILFLFVLMNEGFSQRGFGQYMVVDTSVVFDSKFDNLTDGMTNRFRFVNSEDFEKLKYTYGDKRDSILNKYKYYKVDYYPCPEEHNCLPHDYFSIIIDSTHYYFGLPIPYYSSTKSSFKKGFQIVMPEDHVRWKYYSEKIKVSFFIGYNFVETMECYNKPVGCNEHFKKLVDACDSAIVELINAFGDKLTMKFELKE